MFDENTPKEICLRILTSEHFIKELRFALNHLYDYDNLKKSVLIHFLGITDRFDAPSVLRNVLLEAIHACRPSKSDPICSMRYRIHQILTLRYEQQFHQKEIAYQMNISDRQYRRLQKIAIGELASRLVMQFDLSRKFQQSIPINPNIDTTEIPEEISWISRLPSNLSTRIKDLVPEILSLVRPLADQHQKVVDINISEDLPEIAMPPQVLRHVILSLLNAMVLFNSGSLVSFSAHQRRWVVEICASASYLGPDPLPETIFPNLKITQAMLTFYGGKLDFSTKQRVFLAQAILPAIDQITVLVIDDNPDALNLFQHYVYGTRYRIIASNDPTTVFELVETHKPQVILIDIMMPDLDGWEILVRLKNHPTTGQIPVVVCTVLDQAELALSLGANGFLHKPVTRQSFLRELDHQVEQLG